VAPSEVHPPADRLDLKSWLATPSDAAPPSTWLGDVTVVMQGGEGMQGDQHTRTVRRHYPWTYTEDRYGDGWRRLSFRNETQQLDIRFESNPAGEPATLTIDKRLRVSSSATYKPPDSGRMETVLGELCSWSVTFVDRHGHTNECRTADGVVLKETGTGLWHRELIAVELSRSAIILGAVRPPPSIFTLATWGIPD